MRLAPLLPLLLSAAACGGTIQGPGDAGDLPDGPAPDRVQPPPPPPFCNHGPPVSSGPCGQTTVTIYGSLAACGLTSTGMQSMAACTELCGSYPPDGCTIGTTPNTVECGLGGCIGRRPAGLAELDLPSDVGAYFGWMAALEAASVDAFSVMESELASHGAPKRLLARARRAARDERRHARMVGSLARRFGAVARVPQVASIGPRSLEASAMENAVEGCVRETWGAVAGAWQARASSDGQVRAVLSAISTDEVRHAELSWAVHVWAMKRLDDAARSRVRAAMRAAAEELRRQTAHDPPEELVRTAGLPRGAEARALLDALDQHVWTLEIERDAA